MNLPPAPQLLIVCALALGGCAATPAPPAPGSGQQAGAAGAAAASTAAQPADTAPPAAAGSSDTPGGGAGSADANRALTASGNGPGQTSEERRAAIDKQLADSLGSFDAQLRTEQQKVAQERDQRQAARAGSAATERAGADKNGDAGSAEGDERPAGSGRRGPFSRPRDHSGDLKSEKASNKPDDNAGNGATAREVPDGSDDDVVARRLRKAAEQETDPELKEKLWQEYRDYKKNTQNK